MPSGPVDWQGSLPDHIQIGDLLTGPGTPWYVAADGSITGWEESPAVDSGTVPRAQQHGSYLGTQLAQSRIVTIEMIVRSDPGQMDTVIRQLAAAVPIDADQEAPLIVQLDQEPLLAWARCTRWAAPVGRDRSGGIGRAVLQFECTDPRRYQLTEETAVTGLPQPEPGLSWGSPEATVGLAWGSPEASAGLAWGAPGSTGDLACANSGLVATHPVIEIRGPVITPRVSILGTNLLLEYGLTLTAADTLVIDCWAGTVTLGGQDRLPAASLRSVPEQSFSFPRLTTSTVSFRSADAAPDPAASCTVRWRPAYW